MRDEGAGGSASHGEVGRGPGRHDLGGSWAKPCWPRLVPFFTKHLVRLLKYGQLGGTGAKGPETIKGEDAMTLLSERAPHLFGAGRQPQPARPSAPPVRRPKTAAPAPTRLSMRPTTVIKGEVVRLLPIGDLAAAIGRSVGHVRLLEKRGVLPPAPARRRVQGHRGWRMYDARYVAALGVIAAEERIPTRKSVYDMSAFKERAWAAHRAIHATAGREPA